MVVRAVTRYLRRTKGASRKTSEATGKRSNELAVPQSPDFGFVLLPEKKEARNEDENTENEHRHVGHEDDQETNVVAMDAGAAADRRTPAKLPIASPREAEKNRNPARALRRRVFDFRSSLRISRSFAACNASSVRNRTSASIPVK